MTNAFGNMVDSGAFRRRRSTMHWRRPTSRLFDAAQGERGARILRGLGFAYHIKGTGGSPHENVDIRFEADGTVSLITGTQTIGQGHETTFPQILADRLGLPNERIRLVRATPTGSRWAAGTAARARPIWAARRSGAPRTRLSPRAPASPPTRWRRRKPISASRRRFVVAGTDRSVALLMSPRSRATRATPLDTYHAWTRERMTFPNGAHVVEVEIDRDTGEVSSPATPRSMITACWSTR